MHTQTHSHIGRQKREVNTYIIETYAKRTTTQTYIYNTYIYALYIFMLGLVCCNYIIKIIIIKKNRMKSKLFYIYKTYNNLTFSSCVI